MIRKTKIIATIGPATSSKEMLRKIIQRGVNVCRLNFSHLEHD
ncbi:MAG: pyruvate kinase, partial [Flavobacteriales bacterium]